MNRVVVVGNGMAGARFAQELVARTDRFAITVVGEEPGGAYNRVLLSSVLAGTSRADAITLADENWYARHTVTLESSALATVVDRPGQAVHLADGRVLPYDTLVLATGSRALLPPIPGLCTADGTLIAGATPFRTRADCEAIDTWATDAKRAVVVGAGVLGLEAARALAGRGLSVTVVQRADRLMEQQLDAAAGRLLNRTLRSLGVDVAAGATVTEVHGGGAVAGVTLSDGRRLAADLLVLCCGVRPRVELARETGLRVATGVVVDDRLRSSDPAVLAIGECAEHRGRTYGLVAPVWEQARVAAELLADPSSSSRYRGSVPVTRLKAAGIELATMGDESARDDPSDDEAELVTFADHARGVYQKLVVQDGRLVAAILLGDTRTAGTVTQLFERRAVLPTDRAALLIDRRTGGGTPGTADSPTGLPARATICQCNGVTKAAITSAWEGGARTVAEVAACTRATTGCGTCSSVVAGLVEWLAASG